MPCCYCNSLYHLSRDCDIYVTDESREEILYAHKFSDLSLLKFQNDVKKVRICYICFSKTHLNDFCPERKNVPKLFLPKIDDDLLARFMQILNASEKYSLAFSSQKAFNLADMMVIQVYKECKLSGERVNDESRYTAVSHSLKLSNVFPYKCSAVLSQKLICLAKDIEIFSVGISTRDLFYLLSPRISLFNCSHLKLSSNVKLEDILNRISNVENVEIVNSDVRIEDSWIAEFEKYSNMEKCRRIVIDLKNSDFNVTQIADFLDTKCLETMELTIIITDYPEFELHQSFAELRSKIFEKFAETLNPLKQMLDIGIRNRQNKRTYIGPFERKA